MNQPSALIPVTTGWLRVLRLGLLMSACGWGISFMFTFSPWERASYQLYVMGADRLTYDPLLDYWLKMASSVFGCIGIASALACWKPHRFASFIHLLAPFHFIIGAVLVCAAAGNHLNPKRQPTFIPDITFCFLTATLISLPLVFDWWKQCHRPRQRP